MARLIAFTLACALAASSAAQSALQPADAPERPADANEKIVCKTFTRIGTLASRYRTCKTKGEWQRERDNLRKFEVTDSCRTRYLGMPGGTADCS